MNQVKIDNGVKAWAMSSSQYVQNAVSNVETYLKTKNLSLPKRANAPFTTGYHPETDVSPELGPIDAAYYQSLIGI